MNKFRVISLGAVIILGLIGLGVFFMRDNRPELEREIAKASTEFKAAQHFRSEPAKKLIPQLKIGTTAEKVQALLGPPDKETDNGLLWTYVVDYSQFIDVRFDSDRKVQEVVACAHGIGGESADANKPSGYYKLEK